MQERQARPSRLMQAFHRSTICMLDDIGLICYRILREHSDLAANGLNSQHIPRLEQQGLQGSQTHGSEYLVHDEKICFAVDCAGKQLIL